MLGLIRRSTKRLSRRSTNPPGDPPPYAATAESIWTRNVSSALSYEEFSQHFYNVTQQGVQLPLNLLAEQLHIRVIEGLAASADAGTIRTRSGPVYFHLHLDSAGRQLPRSTKVSSTIYVLWVFADDPDYVATQLKWLEDIRAADSDSPIILARCHVSPGGTWRPGRAKDQGKNLNAEILRLGTIYLDCRPDNRWGGSLWKVVTRCAMLRIMEDMYDPDEIFREIPSVASYRFRSFEASQRLAERLGSG